MRRRAFIAILGGAAVWPRAVWAQQPGRKPVIDYLIPANPEPVFGYFKEGLQKLGYIEGRNIHIEFRSAEGKSERLTGLAAELVRLKVDILVAAQTPAITAAKKATDHIPIVMAGAGDPVGTGLIASLSRPGGNITGTSSTTAEVGGKVLELIREVLPSAKRVAVLVNAPDPFAKPFLEQLQTSARTIMLEILPMMIRDTSELSAAFPAVVKRRTDAVIVQPSLPRKAAAELSLKYRLPAVAPSGAFPEEGGLMSYSATVADVHRETAAYVDKILKGAKPADLPVQQPTRFEMAVNLRTAKALGITVPQTILLRADRVIE